MVVAGLGPVEEYLPGLFFDGQPERVSLGMVSILRLPGFLRKLRSDADLTVARVDVAAARTLFGGEYLRVPEWVRSTAEVPETMVALSNRSNSLRQDLRLVRKYGYTTVESKSEADVAAFYTTMFRPHTLARHASAEYLKSLREVTAAWRKGLLLWILLEGRRVAGIIISRQGGTLKLEALGTLQGDTLLLRKGVLAAAYLGSFEYAKKVGCTRIDFGATRPSVNDSLLRYKRKWGATLDAQSANFYRLLTYWPRGSPAVTTMLEDFPLIFTHRGQLRVAHGNPERPLPNALTSGIGAVYVMSPESIDTALQPETPTGLTAQIVENQASHILACE